MRVIGTAGHVDHGKSTLIAALTGVHPDRLKEEREREMTIELGFGWLTLPGGEEIGIVDVPGHRDFIGNMLSGIGGIDAALLVVAADEGVMPQTREHLAILDILQIKTGIVAITKIDMLDDPDWLDLVESDLRTTLQGTVLDGAPFVRVSARAGVGLDALKTALAGRLRDTPPRVDLGRPRLPIDRVFSMPGFGTVVTGTLSDGHLDVGDEVVILPSGVRGRVRGLQTHKKKEDRAMPGSRTAVNISGVAVEELARGQVLSTPGHYTPTRRLDARLRLLPDASAPLKNASVVRCFTGATESMASLRILGADEIAPGDEAWVQLELREPLVAVRGDRYILRRPSPSETLGGGLVVDANPKSRHKRSDSAVAQRLAAMLQGTPAEVLMQASLALGASGARDVAARARLEAEATTAAFAELLASGQIIPLEPGNPDPNSNLLVMAAPHWQALAAQTLQAVSAFHLNFPLRRGMPREELKSRLRLGARLFAALVKKLAAENALVEGGAWVALPEHNIRFNPAQQARVKTVLAKFAAAPHATPSVKEAQAEVGEEVYAALLELGELVQVSAEVVFRRTDYEDMLAQVRGFIQSRGQISVAEARDLFGTSRKYILAFMEHLDASSVTTRDGDFRKLRR